MVRMHVRQDDQIDIGGINPGGSQITRAERDRWGEFPAGTDVDEDKLATGVDRGEHVRIVNVVGWQSGGGYDRQDVVWRSIRDQAGIKLAGELTIIDVGGRVAANAGPIEARGLLAGLRHRCIAWGGEAYRRQRQHRQATDDGAPAQPLYAPGVIFAFTNLRHGAPF